MLPLGCRSFCRRSIGYASKRIFVQRQNSSFLDLKLFIRHSLGKMRLLVERGKTAVEAPGQRTLLADTVKIHPICLHILSLKLVWWIRYVTLLLMNDQQTA